MKYNKLLAFTLVFTMIIAGAKTTAVPSGSFWTWSDNIQQGDFYSWNVQFLINGNPNYDGNNGSMTVVGDIPFSDGSNFTVDVTGQPQMYNESAITSTQYNATFDLRYNNVQLPSDELLRIFIMPNMLKFDNGTTLNYFQYLINSGEELAFFNNTVGTKNQYIQDNYFYLTLNLNSQNSQGDSGYLELAYELDTGLLDHYNINFYNGDGTNTQLIISLDQSSSDLDLRLFNFSSDLNVGDVFIWDVLNLKENGTTVTSSTEDVPVVNGSEIRIEVVGEPETLNLTDPNLDPNQYFKFFLDGVNYDMKDVFDGPDSFFQFIFPVTYNDNGTQKNFFDLIVSNPDFALNNDSVATLNNGIFRVTESYSDQYSSYSSDTQWNATTGVMQALQSDSSWTYDNNGVVVNASSEVYVVLRGGSAAPINSSTSETIGLNLPFTSPVWFSMPIMAIVIVRKFRKN